MSMMIESTRPAGLTALAAAIVAAPGVQTFSVKSNATRKMRALEAGFGAVRFDVRGSGVKFWIHAALDDATAAQRLVLEGKGVECDLDGVTREPAPLVVAQQVAASLVAGKDKKKGDQKPAQKPAQKPLQKPATPGQGKGGSKRDKLIKMMQRAGGATASQMIEAMGGWRPETLRGLLSRLRTDGKHPITLERREGKESVYRYGAAPK